MKNKRILSSMLHVDFRRMFTMPLIYIMVASCLVMPVLILVMTTMMDGSVSVNPQTGEETVVEGFDNVWQIIGTTSTGMPAAEEPEETMPAEEPEETGEQTQNAGAGMGMDMDITSMCNINLLYFIVSVLVCLFVSDDFRSGYAKNLFAVRPKKSHYVFSKTLVCFAGGALMVIAFFAGALLGGKIAGLPFEMVGFNTVQLLMCMLAKVLLMAVFVPVYMIMASIAKGKAWLSILLSLMTGMFMFLMIPLLSPLDATFVHVIGCAAGGILLSVGFGAISNQILKKTSLV